jgi:hypothetical protein
MPLKPGLHLVPDPTWLMPPPPLQESPWLTDAVLGTLGSLEQLESLQLQGCGQLTGG